MGSVSGDEHSQDETMACLESGFQVPSATVDGGDQPEPSPLEGPYDYSIKVQPNALMYVCSANWVFCCPKGKMLSPWFPCCCTRIGARPNPGAVLNEPCRAAACVYHKRQACASASVALLESAHPSFTQFSQRCACAVLFGALVGQCCSFLP